MSKKPENKYWKHHQNQREFIVYQDCILWKKPAWNRLSFTSMHPDFSSEQKYWTFLHTHYRQKESFSISVDRSRGKWRKIAWLIHRQLLLPSSHFTYYQGTWPSDEMRWQVESKASRRRRQHGKAFATRFSRPRLSGVCGSAHTRVDKASSLEHAYLF